MVIVHLSGGFGNQLFSYAFGYAMAKERNDKLVIDTAIQDQDWFFRNPDILKMKIQYDERVTYPIRRDIFSRAIINKINFRRAIGWHTALFREKDVEGFFKEFYEATSNYSNIYLKGNWDSIKYFGSVGEEIKKMYIFQQPLSKTAQKIEDKIRSNKNSVTLHYRRGDYVKLGACIKTDYFINAMRYVNEKLDHPVFYCFSEDLCWVEEQFRSLPFEINYMDYESPDKGMEDFRLIQSGYHQIISNSTYSWWAAYLNANPDKIVVAPNNWTSEFCLQGWTSMQCKLMKN